MPAPSPQFYDSTNTTQITALVAATITAGSTHGPTTYYLWNDKGGTIGADEIVNAYLRAEWYDGTDWRTSGVPMLDEGWIQAQITGTVINTGDANMVAQSSGFIPLGSSRAIALQNIKANCARQIKVQIVAPSGAQSVTGRLRLAVVYSEASVVLGGGTTLWSSSGGIIPAWHDASTRKLTAGALITASGAATVTVARRWYSYDGTPRYAPQSTVTLNQTAADGALASGESYIAVLSQAEASASVTTTKGNKSATPSAPSLPADHILLGKVTVAFQGGGTSVINSGDVDRAGVTFSEYHLEAGAGLNLNIHSGSSITKTDQRQTSTVITSLSLPDGGTSFIYVNPDGTFARAGLSADPPFADSLFIGHATTLAGSIITYADDLTNDDKRRISAHVAVDEYVMSLRYYGSVEVGTALAWDALPFDAVLDSVDVYHATAGVGSSQIYDINFGTVDNAPTTTIYTSQGSDDQRPSVDPGDRSERAFNGHDLRAFQIGTKFAIDCDQAASTTPAVDVLVMLHFRRWKRVS